MQNKPCKIRLKEEKLETTAVNCPNCQARNSITSKDVHADLTRMFPRHYFKCKCCKQWSRIKLKTTPEAFRAQVLKFNISM